MTIKHSMLAVALAAAASTPVHAVHLADTGQALIYPYYTVNAGNQTLLQIHNTHNTYKALSVRFLEGSNSRNVLSFHVYLGPYDTFAAALFAGDENGPALIANPDSSCTVPSFPPQPVQFRTFGYIGEASDGLGDSPIRTREGHFEVIEMGVLDPAQLPEGFEPGNCSNFVQAWVQDGLWTQTPNAALLPPGGGLRGSASIVDVAEGVLYAYNATALGNFSGRIQHIAPGLDTPNIGSASGESAEDAVRAVVLQDDGSVINSSWPATQAVDAVSAVLAAETVHNSFNQEAATLADTAWVISYPTKRFYTDNAPGGQLAADSVAIAPFTDTVAPFDGSPPPEGHLAGPACELVNRDLMTRAGGGPVHGNEDLHCYSTLVREFEADGSLLGGVRRATPTIEFSPPIPEPANGLGRLDYSDFQLRPSTEGHIHSGLPVLALSLERIINANAEPGMLANYAATSSHTAARRCQTDSAESCAD